MAEITYEEARRQIDALAGQAHAAEERGDWQAAVAALERLLAHPCAHHEVYAPEVFDDIHQVHRRAGAYDDAIAAKRLAIEAGCRSVPDPEADIAECHLLAGRRDEADRLFATLAERDREDAWLYNAAGFAYADAGDHREAERWLRAGVDVALATGDPDGVVGQLLDALEASLEALGEPTDDALAERVEAFEADWEPGRPRRPWGHDPELVERACAHCGYDPERSRRESEERARRNRRRILAEDAPEALARLDALPSYDEPEPTRLTGDVALAVGWFPAAEWQEAVHRWPELLDEMPADHRAYSQAIEARVKRIGQAAGGHRMHVAALDVDGLAAHCARQGLDPGSGEGRSSYAAEVERTGQASPWPPGRNEPCWCGSQRKYKKCCGPVPPAADRSDAPSPPEDQPGREW